ncbi:MAG TPA: MG2 domain-containing protein, partial [Planctomycetota bacterium]|nr:MG2 domain-containing protein [Planctomycetota bacterium]
FKIDCPAKGTPRWADTRNWVFDFEQDLPAGIKCEFTLNDGLKTLSGKEVSGQRRFAFSTGGPAIRASNPYQGGRISEDQIFLLTLDAEPEQQTVLDHVSFSVDGVPERIGPRIVSGPEKDRLIKAATYWARYGEDGEESPAERRSPPVLLIQAKQRFPADARVALIWGKGVTTKTGVATEQDQVLNFKTRPAFTASFSCQRVKAEEGCLSFAPMFLQFSAPVSWSQAKKIVLMKGQKKWRPKKPKQEEDEEGGGVIAGNFVSGVSFEGPFPASADFRVELPPQGLVDDSGRRLINADKFPLAVRTGEFPPLAKFSARFGVLELKADPVLPFTVRNIEPRVSTKLLKVDQEPESVKGWIEKIKGRLFKVSASEKVGRYLFWLDQVHRYEEQWNTSVFSQAAPASVKDFTVPKPNGAKAFEVLGLPLKEPGLYIVELESQILGSELRQKPGPMFVPTAALVTNLSVHFKWGHESSIVWVTTLDQGRPAAGADVTVSDCQGNALWTGRTDGDGLARVPALPEAGELLECSNYKGPMRATRLFVSAQLGDDFSFVLDHWTEGIEPWRFQLPYEYAPAAVKNIHTVFDRTLLRAGDTVHMKHILRRQTMEGFSVPSAEDSPKIVVVQHLGSDQTYELPVQFDANGIAETTWDIPKEAKLGTYSLTFKEAAEPENKKPTQPARLYRRSRGGGWSSSASFRVEEFRIPLMRAVIRPPRGRLVGTKAVPIDLSVAYLSGGGAEDLSVKFRSQIQPRAATGFEAFEGFVFANGPPQEQLQRPGPKAQEPELQTVELNLDRTGNGHTVVE